jgi:hypothetical protein
MIAAILIASTILQPPPPALPEPPFTPTADYARRELLGVQLYLHPDLKQHPDELSAALDELESQLRQIRRVLPDNPLRELLRTPVWIEWEVKPRGACEVHVSAGWLTANGYNPDKLYAMEINNVRNFVAWSRKTQPWMVLHELAHAYHHRVLGAEFAPLHDTFRAAQAAQNYESVKFVHGGTRRAYALTDASEYFAELTEAYFGRNDFYPFTAAELKEHDPLGFEFLERTWGRPVNRAEMSE